MYRDLSSATAFRFVLIIGIANLFADMTYEGARSVTGAFLGSLGASAAVVGFTAGFGELVGYTLRSVTGYLSDRSGRYWLVAIVGYVINLLAVPALALAAGWPLAAALIITERTGRAIRKPSTQAMLAAAGSRLGSGWVFGLNEALDQTGATIGPLIIALVLTLKGSYQAAFAVLLIPALLAIATVFLARFFFPNPHDLEAGKRLEIHGFTRSYWLYLAAGACVAAGFADFALIAYHFQTSEAVLPSLIAVYYAIAMAVGGIGALILGRLLDKVGLPVLVAAFVVSSLFAPLVFWGNTQLALVGVILWGIGIGAQESLLKASVAGVIGPEKRGMAFGLFDTGFGIAWFLGSAFMGVLYGYSLAFLVVFSVVLQLAAVPFLVFADRRRPGARS
jgi:MFS family permease